MLLWTLVTAGLLGGVGQLVLLGGVKATIDIAYCNCRGFKEQEVVKSAPWAQMVVEGAGQFIVQVASLFAAAGVVLAARLFGGRSMPDGWALLSYVLAAVVALTAIARLHRPRLAVRRHAVADDAAHGRAEVPMLGAVAGGELQRIRCSGRRDRRRRLTKERFACAQGSMRARPGSVDVLSLEWRPPERE